MDHQDVFVGRQDILDKATTFLQTIKHSDPNSCIRLITVQGPGGMGKTKFLARLLRETIEKSGFATTEVLDLRAMGNRSSISLLQTIVRHLDRSLRNQEHIYSSFYTAVFNYNAAKTQEKYALYESVIQAFIECSVNASRILPILIYLDTFESIQDMQLGEWIVDLLSSLRGAIGVVVAGRRDIVIPDTTVLPIKMGGLSVNEIDELGKRLFEYRGIGDDYDLTSDVINKLEYLTDGLPILVVLAIEWILENVDLERIISIQKDSFQAEIVGFLRDFRENEHFEEHLAIMMMATINKRFNPRFLSLLTDWDLNTCLLICKKLSRFSFIKTIPSQELENQTITLHDEMLRLVKQYVDYPEETKNRWRQKIVRSFYEEEIPLASDVQIRQTLIAEMLHYQLRYDPDASVIVFDQHMSAAIDTYNFEFCELLLSELRDPELTLNARLLNIIDLGYAEMLVRRYQPFEAKTVFDRLIVNFDPEYDTEYLSRSLGGLGTCIANGCTLIEASLTEAISLLKESLQVVENKKLEERKATILYQLGYVYDLLGIHEEALKYYDESRKLAEAIGELGLVTTALDDMGKLRRKRYEGPESLALFLKSLAIKERLNNTRTMGVSYHYIGDAYRDLDNFPEALRWYALAEKARQDVADNYGLCVLYGDIGWLYLLDKKWDKAIEYTNKSYYDYAVPYCFGREMAEMEHSYYHIELEINGLDAALPWIEKAFKNAEKYSNTFIYLDAALHLIEAAYEKREWAKLPHYLKKMEEMEEKGCGYRMFRGRALNIMGDVAYTQGNLSEALDYWQEGYTIVAIHGRSRSSVLCFEDHLKLRFDKLIKTLNGVGLDRAHTFQSHWERTILDKDKSATLSDEYPAMIGLCRIAIGDIQYGLGVHNDATKFWFQGMLDIAVQIVLRDKQRVLSLDECLESRKAKITEAVELSNSTIQLELQEQFDHTKALLDFSEEKEFESILNHVKQAFKF